MISVIAFYFFEYFIILKKKRNFNGKKAIIIGASSGIGKHVAIELSKLGFEMGIASRRVEMMKEYSKNFPKVHIKKMDVSKVNEAMEIFNELILQMKGVDVVIINAGIGVAGSDKINVKSQMNCIDVNIRGFTALSSLAMKYFFQNSTSKEKCFYLAGISSISAFRGMPQAPSYSASKAYMLNYLQGLRSRAKMAQKNIIVTEIIPGFVLTDATKNVLNELFWVAPVEKAAKQIVNAILNKKNVAYITRRWELVSYFMKYAPEWIFDKIVNKPVDDDELNQ